MKGNGQSLNEELLRRLSGGTENNHRSLVDIAWIPVNIWTEYLLNASLESYFYTIFLDT